MRRLQPLLAPCALVILALLAAPSGQARATLLILQPNEDLINASDAIVVGEVVGTSARWEQGRIVTDVRVRTDETVKGTVDPTITVVASGGVVDGIGMRVLGAPSYEVGDRALLFLAGSGDRYVVRNLSAGKLPVLRGSDGDHVLWLRGSEVQSVALRSVLDEIRSEVRP